MDPNARILIEYFRDSKIVKRVGLNAGLAWVEHIMNKNKEKEEKNLMSTVSNQGFDKGSIQNTLKTCTDSFVTSYDQQLQQKDNEIATLRAAQSPLALESQQNGALTARVLLDKKRFSEISQALANLQTSLNTYVSDPAPVNASIATVPAPVTTNSGGAATKPINRQGVTYRVRKMF